MNSFKYLFITTEESRHTKSQKAGVLQSNMWEKINKDFILKHESTTYLNM